MDHVSAGFPHIDQDNRDIVSATTLISETHQSADSRPGVLNRYEHRVHALRGHDVAQPVRAQQVTVTRTDFADSQVR